jgi:hypothetical protein
MNNHLRCGINNDLVQPVPIKYIADHRLCAGGSYLLCLTRCAGHCCDRMPIADEEGQKLPSNDPACTGYKNTHEIVSFVTQQAVSFGLVGLYKPGTKMYDGL